MSLPLYYLKDRLENVDVRSLISEKKISFKKEPTKKEPIKEVVKESLNRCIINRYFWLTRSN